MNWKGKICCMSDLIVSEKALFSFRFYSNLANDKLVEKNELGDEYHNIQKAIDGLTEDLVQITRLKNTVLMIELFIERIPDAILQLTFLIASYHSERLRILLSYSLQKRFGMIPVEWIFMFTFGITFCSILKSIINKK